MPRIFFVSQGQTSTEELHGSYLWAPLMTQGNRSHFSYDLIRTVREGDIIIHYSNGSVDAVSIASSGAERCAKPRELSNYPWATEGTRVNLNTTIFPRRNHLQKHFWDRFFLTNQPVEYGPMNMMGNVKQAYFFRANERMLDKILELAGKDDQNQVVLNEIRVILGR